MHELLVEQLAYTPAEAGRVLSIGRTAVFELIRAGKLHPVRLSARKVLLTRRELQRFLDDTQEPHGPHRGGKGNGGGGAA